MTYHPSIAHSTEQTFNQPVHYSRLYVLRIKRRRHEPCLQCSLILEVIECWENNDSREKKEIDLIGTNPRRLLGVDFLNWSLKMNGNVLLAQSGWRRKRQQRKWWSVHVGLDAEWPCLRRGRMEPQAQGHSVVFLEHLYLSAWGERGSWGLLGCWPVSQARQPGYWEAHFLPSLSPSASHKAVLKWHQEQLLKQFCQLMGLWN